MRALVVFESAFGNTERIARADRRRVCRRSCRSTCLEVGGAPRELAGDVDLLVVGGPTQALA